MKQPAPDSAATASLLRLVQEAGDRQAFERLFAQHRAYLHRFVEARLDPRLRGRLDPSDVVQETQLEAFQRLDDYLNRKPMPFRLWLRKTAGERLLKIHRRHLGASRRSLAREVPLPDRSSVVLAQRLLAAGSTPSRELSRHEVAHRVRQALATLPETDREILRMRTADGLPYQEVSRLLGIDAVAARKRYGRALLRLRKVLAASGLLESPP